MPLKDIEAHRKYAREYAKQYRAKNPEKVRENDRRYWASHSSEWKENRRRRALKVLYGLTLEQFNTMSETQNGKCLICKNEAELVVDHCHSTGKVRGLLCNPCNRGLGQFSDSLEFLNNAVSYLNSFPS